MVDSKYLIFKLVVSGEDNAHRKTNIYVVLAKNGGDLLGKIRWFGNWHQYSFFPETDTVWSKGCLEDVNLFLDGANKEHKAMKKSSSVPGINSRVNKRCICADHAKLNEGLCGACPVCGGQSWDE
jgi:hypothetical protein